MRIFVSTNSLPFMQVVSCPANLSVCAEIVAFLQILQHLAPRLCVPVGFVGDLPQSLRQHSGYGFVLLRCDDLESTQEVVGDRKRHVASVHVSECSTLLRVE